MKAETGPEEQSSKVLTLIVIITILVLARVVGLIVCDNTAKTGWIVATNKKAWDVLEVLLVPVAVGWRPSGLLGSRTGAKSRTNSHSRGANAKPRMRRGIAS
jgi:hypothetical protein